MAAVHLLTQPRTSPVVLFEIVPLSPETYRQQTRRSTLIVAATFAALAMGLAPWPWRCSVSPVATTCG
jgi:hypothetical protein